MLFKQGEVDRIYVLFAIQEENEKNQTISFMDKEGAKTSISSDFFTLLKITWHSIKIEIKTNVWSIFVAFDSLTKF